MEFPGELTSLQNLRILNLDGNKLTTLPTELYFMSSLSNLSCKKNKIKKLPYYSMVSKLALILYSKTALTIGFLGPHSKTSIGREWSDRSQSWHYQHEIIDWTLLSKEPNCRCKPRHWLLFEYRQTWPQFKQTHRGPLFHHSTCLFLALI